MNPTVDEYVKTNIAPEQWEIVTALRKLVRECAPNSSEEISYAMPVWKGSKIFAYLNASKKDVTFSFVRGTQIEDRYNLLRGKAKGARYVKIKAVRDIVLHEDALRDYIQQALKLDTL